MRTAGRGGEECDFSRLNVRRLWRRTLNPGQGPGNTKSEQEIGRARVAVALELIF